MCEYEWWWQNRELRGWGTQDQSEKASCLVQPAQTDFYSFRGPKIGSEYPLLWQGSACNCNFWSKLYFKENKQMIYSQSKWQTWSEGGDQPSPQQWRNTDWWASFLLSLFFTVLSFFAFILWSSPSFISYTFIPYISLFRIFSLFSPSPPTLFYYLTVNTFKLLLYPVNIPVPFF